jgi:hypothetical protein
MVRHFMGRLEAVYLTYGHGAVCQWQSDKLDWLVYRTGNVGGCRGADSNDDLKPNTQANTPAPEKHPQVT